MIREGTIDGRRAVLPLDLAGAPARMHAGSLELLRIRHRRRTDPSRYFGHRCGRRPVGKKLGTEQVLAIRDAYDRDLDRTLEDIGLEFGVTGKTVSQIGRRQTWACVPKAGRGR